MGPSCLPPHDFNAFPIAYVLANYIKSKSRAINLMFKASQCSCKFKVPAKKTLLILLYLFTLAVKHVMKATSPYIFFCRIYFGSGCFQKHYKLYNALRGPAS